MILSFDSLDKSYGQTVALRGVTFDVPAGEIFGLLGPNGAGKSTLIRVLMDIIRPDAGTVRVFGEPRRREHLDRLGYLPEERGLYTKLRVIDVLTYFGALKGLARTDARRRALEWLERVELPHVVNLEGRSLEQGHVAEGADRRRPALRPRALRPRRADDRSGSGQCSPRAGPAGRTPPERPQRRSSRRTI